MVARIGTHLHHSRRCNVWVECWSHRGQHRTPWALRPKHLATRIVTCTANLLPRQLSPILGPCQGGRRGSTCYFLLRLLRTFPGCLELDLSPELLLGGREGSSRDNVLEDPL